MLSIQREAALWAWGGKGIPPWCLRNQPGRMQWCLTFYLDRFLLFTLSSKFRGEVFSQVEEMVHREVPAVTVGFQRRGGWATGMREGMASGGLEHVTPFIMLSGVSLNFKYWFNNIKIMKLLQYAIFLTTLLGILLLVGFSSSFEIGQWTVLSAEGFFSWNQLL